MLETNNSNKVINQDEEVSLKELIQKLNDWFIYLKTKWLIIVISGIMGSAIGFTNAYIQKPTYLASLSHLRRINTPL